MRPPYLLLAAVAVAVLLLLATRLLQARRVQVGVIGGAVGAVGESVCWVQGLVVREVRG
eukprot:COSAG02_NODE_179_length_31090_cov_49.813785_29_plen_59_part_00